MLFLLFALLGLAAALPGGGGDGGYGPPPKTPPPCKTSCKTKVTTYSTVKEIPTTYYFTKTTCAATTETTKVTYPTTKTYTKTITKTVVTSYPSTIWVTSSSLSVCPEVYYSTNTETTTKYIPTSVCSQTVCPEVTEYPTTLQYYSTSTTCKVKTATWGGYDWGYDNSDN